MVNGSQNTVLRTMTSTLSENLLEIQTSSPHLRTIKSETLEMEPNSLFAQALQVTLVQA